MSEETIERLEHENERLRERLAFERKQARRDSFNRNHPGQAKGPTLWVSRSRILAAGKTPRQAFLRALELRLDEWECEPDGTRPPIEEFAADVLKGEPVTLDGEDDAVRLVLGGGDVEQWPAWGLGPKPLPKPSKSPVMPWDDELPF